MGALAMEEKIAGKGTGFLGTVGETGIKVTRIPSRHKNIPVNYLKNSDILYDILLVLPR